MKEVKLTEQDFALIKSASVDKWVNYGRGETTLVQSVIDSFIGFCNSKGYIVQDGKVFIKNEEQEERNS